MFIWPMNFTADGHLAKSFFGESESMMADRKLANESNDLGNGSFV